ncbi:hypothetical protein BpHYR1_021403 [Brachionus plicatilis]|uniref:Uncharacterized protein n=1 Tax=Brachionus plicatilis TaxID=10195 RepID=A0A3M7PYX7_BRAPC|nr:hypothetical protein BpHYR1_021403 [Brachionus plicatilis]
MENLIRDIDQYLVQDIQSIADTKLCVSRLKSDFMAFKSGVNSLNGDYRSLRQAHETTLDNHASRLRPIIENIAATKDQISQTQLNINNIQNLINSEKCCCENCIRSIIQTICDNVNEVFEEIRQQIIHTNAESDSSIETDQNLLIQYRCINEHLQAIVTLCDTGLPDLPEEINLEPLKNHLLNLNERVLERNNSFLESVRRYKNRKRSEHANEIDLLSNLPPNFRNANEKVNDFVRFLNNVKNRILDFERRNGNILNVLNHWNGQLRMPLPITEKNDFLLIIGVFLFFILDYLFIK